MRQNQQQIIKYHDCVESTLCRLLTASVFNFKLCFQGRLPECHKVNINPRPMGRQRGKEVNTSKQNTWKVKQERYLTKCSLPSQIQTTERNCIKLPYLAQKRWHILSSMCLKIINSVEAYIISCEYLGYHIFPFLHTLL